MHFYHEPTSQHVEPDPNLESISIPKPEPTMSIDLIQALQALAKNQTDLQQAVTTLLSQSSNTKGVTKLSNYNGKCGNDARHFLTAFNFYADNIPNLVDYKKCITSIISFFEKDAVI